MDAQELQHLSSLLEQALDLDGPGREAWLTELARQDPAASARLRELLSRDAAGEAEHLVAAASRRRALLAPPAFQPGTRIGPYRLMQRLGSGGMGDVWLADRHDGTLNRQVALKLPLVLMRRPLLQHLFERERDILATLAHPHIARLLDAGLADDGQPFLALEYVQGRNIVAYCDEQGLEPRQRVLLIQQVLGAVQHAHANLVVHRDLKPSNVMVTDDGRVMLLDFGIAKLLQAAGQPGEQTELTRLGVRAMTPEHAAPEQLRGGPISIATDVWALGVLLYQLVAGRRPFEAEHRSALERLVLEADPPRPTAVRHATAPGAARLPRSMAADLDTIILKALKKEPAERYLTAASMSEDLTRWLEGRAVEAQPDHLGYRLRTFVARHVWMVVASSVAVVALVTEAGLALWQGHEARAQAERARAEKARAEAVQGFLLDIFRANRVAQGDPERARKTTARELLDTGAARLEQSLKDAPESRLQVMMTLAQMYGELGLTARTLELQRASIELARRVLPADDPRRAEVALALVTQLHTGPHREEARALLAEAGAVLQAPGLRHSPLQRELARAGFRFYRYESAQLAQQHADTILRIASERQPPDVVELADALLRAGAARLTVLDLAGATPLFERGHRLLRERARSVPSVLINGAVEMADLQWSTGRFADAEATMRQALAAAEQVHGPDHRQTLVIGAHLVDVLSGCGRRSDAQALQARIVAAMANAGPRLEADWRHNVNFLLARQLQVAGRPDLLEPMLRDNLRNLAHLPNSPAAAHRRRLLADVLIPLGQTDEAEALLSEALAIWRRYTAGGSEPWMESNLQLSRAELRLAQQRPQEALDILRQVAPSRLPVGAPLDLRGTQRDLAMARAWLALGDAARAMASADAVLQALQVLAPPYGLPARAADAHLVRGQAQLRLGDVAAARSDLQRAVDLRRQHDADGSLPLRQAEQLLAAARAAR